MAAGGICGALYKCTGTQRSVLVVFFHALGLTNPSYSRSQARVRRCDLNDYGSRSLELGQVGHPLVLFSVYVLTFISGLTTTKASERGFVYHYSGSPNTDITFSISPVSEWPTRHCQILRCVVRRHSQHRTHLWTQGTCRPPDSAVVFSAVHKVSLAALLCVLALFPAGSCPTFCNRY